MRRVPRRSLLLGLPALGLAACRPGAVAPALPTAASWPSPVARSGGLVAFLLPGLTATDVLVAGAEGAAPNLAGMVERGLLVEALSAPEGTLYAEAETAVAALAEWQPDSIIAPCQRYPRPVRDNSGTTCPGAAADATALAARWHGLLERAQADIAGGATGVCVLDDGLLAVQVDGLLADARQPGYDSAGAEASAIRTRSAIVAADAALGGLLRALDLSLWTVALLSHCEAWPVHTVLDPAGAGIGAYGLLDQGALLQTAAEVALPEGEPWSLVTAGHGPGGHPRLLAPPGYCFAAPTPSGSAAATPEATPEPPPDAAPAAGPPPPTRASARFGGFLLAVGASALGGVRLSALSPAQLAGQLARLAVGDAA